MWGLCDPLTTPRPLGPLIDIAPQLGDGISALLAGTHREGVFEATLAALASLPRAAVVVFEDLQWADESTLDLLRFLGRRISGMRVLLLATYRDDQLGRDNHVRTVLGDLASERAARRLTVPPLTLDAVSVLARTSGIDAERLHRETGGNAFFVTEVLSGGADGVPATVSDAVLTRAARLTPAARAVLDAAAVLGPRIEPSLLLDMEGANPVELDECVTNGVLRFNPPNYSFRHELARQAILDAISPARRIALHAQVLEGLRRSRDHLLQSDRLAHHADGAGDAAAVLQYAPAAARAAASMKSHREAAAHYRRALRWADSIDAAARASLLECTSYECYLIDDLTEAVQLSEQALQIRRSLGDSVRIGKGLCELSRVYWVSGRTPDAEAAADEAISVLERQPPGSELALAYSIKAQRCMLAYDGAGAELWGGKAIALARALGEQQMLAHALNSVGSTRMRVHDPEGEQMLLESLHLSVDLGLEDDASRAWTNLSATHHEQMELDKAREYIEEGIRYCDEHDLDSSRFCMGSELAEMHFQAGRWEEAIALTQELHKRVGLSRITTVLLLATRARVHIRRGDGGADAMLAEALDIAKRAGDLQFLAPVA